jgi:hypothetical protein
LNTQKTKLMSERERELTGRRAQGVTGRRIGGWSNHNGGREEPVNKWRVARGGCAVGVEAWGGA